MSKGSKLRVPAKWFSLIALSLVAAAPFHTAANSRSAQPDPQAISHIFFSAGCVDCWPYVEDVLLPTLQGQGFAVRFQIHDYTIPAERAFLLEVADGISLPRSIADSLYVFVPTEQGTLVILGHVPEDLITAAVTSKKLPERLVLWQPEMHAEPSEYRLWAWQGAVLTFPIDAPFEKSLERTLEAEGPFPVGVTNLSGLFPLVIATGLLDSVNPCAFAVILLLIAFLFTLRQSRSKILKLGLVYILMIFLVYFAIGLGILRAVKFSDDPHLVARAGSWILVGLGAINLLEYFFPKFPIKLHMPAFAAQRSTEMIKRATFPATVVAGFLVGLCTFPCSGGIYVSVITLLNQRTTLSWGLAYLFLYNLMFVLPLFIILIAVGNRKAAKAWARWERTHALRIRLWYGLMMVGLGALMLAFVIN